MCELGVFPIFFRERSFKSRQNPRADFFKGNKKTWKDSIRRFSIYCSWVLCSIDCLQLPCIRVEEAVSLTHLFLTRKFWLKTNKFKRKCLQKIYVSSRQEKDWYSKTTSYLTSSPRGVWLIVAGRGSRVQCRGRGSNVAVAGPKSRSRVQCRGRGKLFGVRGNSWVKTTDMSKI